MSHSHDSEPNFEKLSKAITEAVMSSEKVRKIVEEIQKSDEICPQSFMVLVLKMQVLTESLELNIEQDDVVEKPVVKKRTRKNKSGKPKRPSEYGLRGIEEVFIDTLDNLRLLAWFKKPKNKNPILVYFHGNSFDIGERAYRIKRYIDQNWAVLLVAWRGYSGNKGNPTEKNLYIDGEAAIKWIIENTNYQFKDLVIYGESLGSGIAVELGKKYEFASIVLEAPFTSVADIARQRYRIFPTKFLVKDKFNNLEKINKLKSPLLIISGKKDEIVPHIHSQKLFKEAKVEIPIETNMLSGGKQGLHTEHLGHLLSEMQYLQRSFPDAKW